MFLFTAVWQISGLLVEWYMFLWIFRYSDAWIYWRGCWWTICRSTYNDVTGDAYKMPSSQIALSQLCAARYSVNGDWHRSYIVDILPNKVQVAWTWNCHANTVYTQTLQPMPKHYSVSVILTFETQNHSHTIYLIRTTQVPN